MGRWLLVLGCLLWPLAGSAAEPLALPPLAARVTDLTGTLPPGARAALEADLAAIEAEKGAQVGILLLPGTQPESIEQFGIRLAEAWKLGRSGVNDGVIVIVAKEERRMRIEVGYGLEGAIPDAVAKRIVDELMAPRFRQGDYAGGLQAAVQALGGLIRGEALPLPAQASPDDSAGWENAIFLFVALFVLTVLIMLGRAGGRWQAGPGGSSGGWSAGGGGGDGGSGSDFSGGGGDFGGGGASGSW